jgi:alkanesulfonate monooxygenase SsuD/methylene tetrahydromethanopterin reductase-like flavin-dependent oxidoreductase (luciferase family)
MAEQSPFNGGTRIVGTPDQVAAYLRQFTDLGVTYFILRFADFPDTAGVALFGREVVPRFRG